MQSAERRTNSEFGVLPEGVVPYINSKMLNKNAKNVGKMAVFDE